MSILTLAFFWSHHFSTDKLVERIVALDIQSQSLHKTQLGLISAIELEHQNTSQVTHRCFDLSASVHVPCQITRTYFYATIRVRN